MSKEWILLAASTVATLVLALAGIRWFAPQLLGIPVDLQMVQVGERIAPYFDGVFRYSDFNSSEFIIKDPYVARAKPLFPDYGGVGPNDLLGFRNRSIPNAADVIVIGDSQTYGNNASLEQNWPNQLRSKLSAKRPVIYTAAVGGWGAVEYLEIFPKLLFFRPGVVLIAFYSGNDSIDSFRKAYASDRWSGLRADRTLTPTDAPSVEFPAPPSQQWKARFLDGTSTTFTARLRLAANSEAPAVRAGYGVMAEVARRQAEIADAARVNLVFTIIPTKELVYARKVQEDDLQAPDDYRTLVRMEARNIKSLASELEKIPRAKYVDVVASLQTAALGATHLYPSDVNGHPVAAGYEVIAAALKDVVDDMLLEPIEGLAVVQVGEKQYEHYIVREDRVWFAPDPALVRANGWELEGVPTVSRRRLANFPRAGIIDAVDRTRFGPATPSR